MDELSAQDIRGAAFASNLRRAFAAPADGDLPKAFRVLLDRLGECRVAPPSPPREPRWPSA